MLSISILTSAYGPVPMGITVSSELSTSWTNSSSNESPVN